MRISNTNEFWNLLDDDDKKEEVKELVVNENSCEDIKDDLEISGFKNLEKIVFKKGCLQNLNSLKICGNENLKFIEVGDSVFCNVQNIIMESNIVFNCIISIFLIYNHS